MASLTLEQLWQYPACGFTYMKSTRRARDGKWAISRPLAQRQTKRSSACSRRSGGCRGCDALTICIRPPDTWFRDSGRPTASGGSCDGCHYRHLGFEWLPEIRFRPIWIMMRPMPVGVVPYPCISPALSACLAGENPNSRMRGSGILNPESGSVSRGRATLSLVAGSQFQAWDQFTPRQSEKGLQWSSAKGRELFAFSPSEFDLISFVTS